VWPPYPWCQIHPHIFLGGGSRRHLVLDGRSGHLLVPRGGSGHHLISGHGFAAYLITGYEDSEDGSDSNNSRLGLVGPLMGSMGSSMGFFIFSFV